MSDKECTLLYFRAIPGDKKAETDSFRSALKPHFYSVVNKTLHHFSNTVLYWPPPVLLAPFVLPLIGFLVGPLHCVGVEVCQLMFNFN